MVWLRSRDTRASCHNKVTAISIQHSSNLPAFLDLNGEKIINKSLPNLVKNKLDAKTSTQVIKSLTRSSFIISPVKCSSESFFYFLLEIL